VFGKIRRFDGQRLIVEVTISSSNALSTLLGDIASVQDKVGEDKQLFIQISTKVKSLLEQDTALAKYISARDMTVKGVNLKIDAINEQFLIGTPSAYMKNAFSINDGRTAGQTIGGVVVSDLASGINWIISTREAADAIARPYVSKVIDPDTNQEGEFWKIMFSIYHGAWTYENKESGLYVNYDPALGALTVTSQAGTSEIGDTLVSVDKSALDSSTKFVYKIAESTAPAVAFGTALAAADGWTDLPAANVPISTTNGHKITVALIDATSRLPVASGNTTVVAKTE